MITVDRVQEVGPVIKSWIDC